MDPLEAPTEGRALAATDGERRKSRRRRLRRLHTRTVPALRLLGGNLLVLGVVLHNAWILGGVEWSQVLWFMAYVEAYALGSWWTLYRRYDPDARLDLGLVFFALDVLFLAMAVWLTGATASWLFWIFLFRVVDQTSTNFARAMAFTVLGTLGYLVVVLGAAAAGAVIPWEAEAAKLIFLFLGGTYMSLNARTSERMRGQRSHAVRVARRSIRHLRRQSVELERAREAAEAGSQAKSAFLSRVSHELRTPMNAILGFAQLLEMERDLSPEQRSYVDEIMEGGRHLLDIINEVLDIARVETGSLAQEIEPVALDRAMADVLERARPVADRRRVALPERPPESAAVWVAGNPRKVRQVFANLVSNAIKYNSSPGRVEITCGATADRVRVEVTDTGPGIPEDRVEAAFTPFDRLGAEQRGIEGTGLGLAVARSLVEAMDGEIGVDTAPGRGSTFWFELVRTEAPAPSEEAASAEGTDQDRDRDGPVVLYIDDKPENVALVRRILARRAGVEVLSAPLGARGVEDARARRPDLILLDMQLPDISGGEVLARLQEDPETRQIPVVVVSADASRARVEQLLQDGARAYFTMPYDIAAFFDTVDSLLP